MVACSACSRHLRLRGGAAQVSEDPAILAAYGKSDSDEVARAVAEEEAALAGRLQSVAEDDDRSTPPTSSSGRMAAG